MLTLNTKKCVVFVTFGLSLAPLSTTAGEPTFTELLARAQAEAEAGKQWLPPGDNVVETSIALMAMINKATPEQVDELGLLLRQQAASMPQSTKAPLAPSVAPSSQESKTAVSPATPQADTTSGKNKRPNSSTNQLAADMFERGKDAEAHSDISGARRYYKVAAENQHAGAARALARLYDPAWLSQRYHGGIRPDPEAAEKWYRHADALDGVNIAQFPQSYSTR